MYRRTSRLGRLVAAITLPCVLSACMSWQQQELTGLRDVIVLDQPDKVRVRTRFTGDELEIERPQVSGDTISGGYGPRQAVSVPFADLTEASLQEVDDGKTALFVLGMLGVAALGVFLATYEAPSINIFGGSSGCAPFGCVGR